MKDGKNLDFDACDWGMRRAEIERALLTEVHAFEGDLAGASTSATQLLRWFVRFGKLHAPEVHEAVLAGTERVMQKVCAASLEVRPGARVDITPLDYFVSGRRPLRGGGPKKAGVKQTLLDIRAAYGDFITESDAQVILTSVGGRSLPREKWPATIGQLEAALVDFLSEIYSDTPVESRRAFVRGSFPNIPWGEPKRSAIYPAHW